MTEEKREESEQELASREKGRSNCSRRRRFRRRLFIGLGLLAIAAIAIPVFGSPFGGFGRGGEVTPERARRHMGRMVHHALDEVDATGEQRTAIDAILDQAVPDFVALATEGRGLKEQFRAALLDPEIDPAKLESLRQEGLAVVDKMSKLGLTTLTDAANVLTPEQRVQLGAFVDEMRERRRSKWHHKRHHFDGDRPEE